MYIRYSRDNYFLFIFIDPAGCLIYILFKKSVKEILVLFVFAIFNHLVVSAIPVFICIICVYPRILCVFYFIKYIGNRFVFRASVNPIHCIFRVVSTYFVIYSKISKYKLVAVWMVLQIF